MKKKRSKKDVTIKTSCLLFIVLISQVETSIVPPAWADPSKNPCASLPGGWQLLYWEPLDKCFKIFQTGYPCPETMELTPAATGSRSNRKSVGAECRCPPGTTQSAVTKKCYKIFERGPCELGQYFSPVYDPITKTIPAKSKWGTCKTPKQCSDGMIYWPNNMQCYKQFARGPCSKGKLLSLNSDKIAECMCKDEGNLEKYHYENGLCFEHFTKGPCETEGDLFLPEKQCGCHSKLPQYHEELHKCFEIGSLGPCPPGHTFLISDDSTIANTRASCQCKEGYVQWNDGLCYRLYTKGPCEEGEFLVSSNKCIKNPCSKNRLYFPGEKTCYRIGSTGPCSLNQVVIFDLTSRPSIDGISYNGVCGCSGVIMNLDQHCQEDNFSQNTCESVPGMVEISGQCYKLYSRGPCGPGQWLESSKDTDETTKSAVCRCRPGYTSYVSENGVTGCYAPSVSLARWLLQIFGYGKNDEADAPVS